MVYKTLSGVAMRNTSETKRRYSVAHTAFFTVYDEPTAYWLGLLFADGCVSGDPRRPTLSLSLKEADRDHLCAFLRFLDSDYPITPSPRQRAVRVLIYSAQMVDDLTGLGCTLRKSLSLTWPPILEGLAAPFIRGYFDGDGSAYRSKGSPTLSFVGNPGFLHAVQERITVGTGATGRCYPHCKSRAHYLVYHGEFQVAAVRDWLYQDATVWRPRKRERLESYGSGKRKGYPTRQRYSASAGNVSQATIQAYIDAPKGLR